MPKCLCRPSVYSCGLLLLLRQLLGFPLLVLDVLLSKVLHDVIEVPDVAGPDVSRRVGLQCPESTSASSLLSCARTATYSGYETLANLCLLDAFSNRFRSKPACSMAFVCSALISSQCSGRERYLPITFEMTDSSPSLGANW